MRTFTIGLTPEIVIKTAIEKYGIPFTAGLVGATGEMVEEIVNLGIDASLEACYILDRGDSYEWVGGTIMRARHLKCVISTESLPVLLRRLYEHWEKTGNEDALSLRCDILALLDIEEV